MDGRDEARKVSSWEILIEMRKRNKKRCKESSVNDAREKKRRG